MKKICQARKKDNCTNFIEKFNMVLFDFFVMQVIKIFQAVKLKTLKRIAMVSPLNWMRKSISTCCIFAHMFLITINVF